MSKPSLPRLYVTDTLSAGSVLELNRDQSHYLVKVLRKSVGDPLLLFNGSDGEWSAAIESATKNEVQLICHRQTKTQITPPPLALCFAPLKSARMDTVLEKATELGVTILQPIRTEFTQIPYINAEKWQHYLVEAAEQCERMDVPALQEYRDLHSALDFYSTSPIILADESGAGKAFHEAVATKPPLSGIPVLCVGPEGGFSRRELDALHRHPHIIPVSLGPRILRADTASITLIGLWQSRFGDWNLRPNWIAQQKA